MTEFTITVSQDNRGGAGVAFKLVAGSDDSTPREIDSLKQYFSSQASNLVNH